MTSEGVRGFFREHLQYVAPAIAIAGVLGFLLASFGWRLVVPAELPLQNARNLSALTTVVRDSVAFRTDLDDLDRRLKVVEEDVDVSRLYLRFLVVGKCLETDAVTLRDLQVTGIDCRNLPVPRRRPPP